MEEPYCLWEGNVRERNKQFLDGLDPDYFEFLFQAYMAAEDERRAMVALQMGLHHATEVMFSLLGAIVQAPHCTYAWIGKCSNQGLRELVERVNRRAELLNPYPELRRISWDAIAGIVMRAYRTGTQRQAQMIQGFADFWRRLANAFINTSEIEQYNALKHGFRVRSGGFKLAIALEDPDTGKPGPAQSMGGSDFGVTFFALERIHGREKYQLRSKSTSVNWEMDRVVQQFQLVAMSIRNTVSALLVESGKLASECKFLCPEEVEDFSRPWHKSSGVTSASIDYELNEDGIPKLSRDELLKRLRELHETPAG
ncbi:hypothetical protein [Tahibacter harae]|uniref:Uncharacterized protein n=1 Tax=Tahibacter harae TaxID=2963937 RepID=A0ABT1QVS7_9GAMM|nr:hypothetical protein [Tahibacter harae]MCQ4166387.1 hypothetical protein [Tahibacter harae]